MDNILSLKPHQIIPITFMKYNRAIILYHSTGSGKTLTSLYALKQFVHEIIIIGNKSSQKSFVDDIIKAEIPMSKFTFYTYSKIKKKLHEDITLFKNKSVIIDEAHTIRNENINNLYIFDALSMAKKIMLLSATPIVNYMNDLAVLVNIVRNNEVLPTERKLFDQMFYDEDNKKLINVDILVNKIKNTISYYSADTDDINYPRKNMHYMRVEMNHEQIDEYVYHVKKIIYAGETLVDTHDVLNIDYGLLPGKKKNSFLNVTRQISNIVGNISSPKIDEIIHHIVNGPKPSIVYSNFLKNGIYAVAVILEKMDMSYKTISGSTSNDKLRLIVDRYNMGMYQVLLISSAGSESLDLKNTRQIHIMENHWNDPKIQQVIGRAIRYKSHSKLPIDERIVDIYMWISVFPKQIKNKSADEYMMTLSQEKLNYANMYHDVIIQSSIENNFMASDNSVN